VPTAVRRSDVLPIARTVEGPSLEAVPVVAVTRDDLAWFEFEAETNALLAMIDGHTTVGELLASVAVPPDRAMTLLRDLELQLQRVIALTQRHPERRGAARASPEHRVTELGGPSVSRRLAPRDDTRGGGWHAPAHAA
jgi:hypothetical protein